MDPVTAPRLEHCFLAAYTVELIMRLLEDCNSVVRDPWVRFVPELKMR